MCRYNNHKYRVFWSVLGHDWWFKDFKGGWIRPCHSLQRTHSTTMVGSILVLPSHVLIVSRHLDYNRKRLFDNQLRKNHPHAATMILK